MQTSKLLPVALLLAGCSSNSLGEVVRPKPQNAQQAMGEGACRQVPERGTPLVVDWKSHQRTDLEEAMRGGVAVVAYDCESLELLPDCRLEGRYGYMGASPKEDTIQLVDADEIRANLPAGGVNLAGELKRGSSLDLALMLVGKRRTTLRSAKRAQLVGDPAACKRATHFVRGAYVGAFAMATGTAGRVASAAELFSVGASAESESQRKVAQRDGDPSKCAEARLDGESPPPGCGAVLRLELKSLGDDPALAAAETEAADCPKGMVEVSGKCTARGAEAHVCRSDDPSDCKKQCDAGNAESCSRLAYMTHYGRHGVRQDLTAARALYEKACAAGVHNSCSGLGFMYGRGAGGLPRDHRRATELHRRACEGGDTRGCNNLGQAHQHGRGVAKDEARAVELYRRACDGGHAVGCNNLGALMILGAGGLRKDVVRGAALYQRACDAGEGIACVNLAHFYRYGTDGHPKDEAKADALSRQALDDLERSCTGHIASNCLRAANIHENGWGVARSLSLALPLVVKGCELNDGDSCNKLGYLTDHGKGTPKSEAKARGLFEKACQLGSVTGCVNFGLHLEYGRGGAPKDPRRAVEFYARACDRNHANGCSRLGHVLELGKLSPTPDYERIVALYRRGCDGGDALGCNELGVMHARGKGGLSVDPRRAAALYEKACEKRNGTGCYNLGKALEKGEGAPKDTEQALERYGQGCKLGHGGACSSQRRLERGSLQSAR